MGSVYEQAHPEEESPVVHGAKAAQPLYAQGNADLRHNEVLLSAHAPGKN